jgi:hypothetical protein
MHLAGINTVRRGAVKCIEGIDLGKPLLAGHRLDSDRKNIAADESSSG